MRTLLQDLAEKSLKGLGTKAWTNWEDRSANSLAYQVSNHSIFLCTGCLSLRSSHLMGAILHHFKGFCYASELQPDAPNADIFYERTCFSAVIFTHCQGDASLLPFWGTHQHLKLRRYSPYLSTGGTDTPQQRHDKQHLILCLEAEKSCHLPAEWSR